MLVEHHGDSGGEVAGRVLDGFFTLDEEMFLDNYLYSYIYILCI